MKLVNEMDQRIYREELAPFLPRRIFDAHVHVFSKSFFPPGFAFKPLSVYNKFGGEFPIELWRELMKELLPEQEVWVNCFSTPNLKVNRDCVPEVNRKTEFGMVVVSPADRPEEMIRRIEATKAVGVKPYLNLAADFYSKPSNDVEIRDMLTPGQLDYLNEKGLAITLHIPRSGRFADPVNQRQMVEICEKYPNIKIIFAHIGRAYFMRNIKESNIDELVKYPNAYFDTAMVNGADILHYTFDHFPAERVLFGTDSPIALLRGKSVEINNQYAYLMGENYKIGTAIIDTEKAVEFTTFYYEQLRAVIAAAPAGCLEKVLFSNAEKLFKGIVKS